MLGSSGANRSHSTSDRSPATPHRTSYKIRQIGPSRLSRIGVDCSYNDASPAAPKGNIYACSPSSASADACWVAADHVHVLCLADPESHTLVELTPEAMPTGAAQHTYAAEPILLDLDNGDRCRLRNGGSWEGRPSDPDLAGTYGCTKARAVWASSTPGINTSAKLWTVRTGNATGPLTTHNVTTAYFVATAP